MSDYSWTNGKIKLLFTYAVHLVLKYVSLSYEVLYCHLCCNKKMLNLWPMWLNHTKDLYDGDFLLK